MQTYKLINPNKCNPNILSQVNGFCFILLNFQASNGGNNSSKIKVSRHCSTLKPLVAEFISHFLLPTFHPIGISSIFFLFPKQTQLPCLNAEHQPHPLQKTTPSHCSPPNAKRRRVLPIIQPFASSENQFQSPRPAPSGPTVIPMRSYS